MGSTRSIGGAAVVGGLLFAFAVAKVALAFALYDPAKIWLHCDDYCRALMSYEWGRLPYWYPSDLHWLPLQFYVYGLASRLTGRDMQLVFVIVSQILCLLTVLPIYGIGRELFSRSAGLVAAGLYTFAAWQIVMSYSALAEPLYYCLSLMGIWCFVRWWLRGRLTALAGAAVFCGLAAAARYEGWLLLILLTGCGGYRLYQTRPGRRTLWATVAMLAAPWSVPGLWLAANLRAWGVPLTFWSANRDSFHQTLWQLGPFERAGLYPLVLISLSPLLTGLFVLTLGRFKAVILKKGGLLAVLAAAHLALMVVLFVSGSGPCFVHRIVLFHLFLLMPMAAALLVALWAGRQRLLRLAVVAFGLAWVTWEPYRAHDLVASQRWSDYRGVTEAYVSISSLIRDELPRLEGVVVVHAMDEWYIRVSSRAPDRVVCARGDNIEDVLEQHDATMLCILRADCRRWVVDDRVEQAFRHAHATDTLVETVWGQWSVLRVDKGGDGSRASAGAT